MANEIQVRAGSGSSIYFLTRNSAGQIWNTNTSAWENYSTASYANYKIAMAEQGVASGYFTGNFPTLIGAGTYDIVAKQQSGGSPAETDAYVGTGNFEWSGTVQVPLSDLATSGLVGQLAPIRIVRGVMVQNFPLFFVSAADGITPFTSGVCSGGILRDGAGGFVALQSGAFTEQGRGCYTIQALTSGDLLCATAALSFSCAGISGGSAVARNFSIIAQTTSGN